MNLGVRVGFGLGVACLMVLGLAHSASAQQRFSDQPGTPDQRVDYDQPSQWRFQLGVEGVSLSRSHDQDFETTTTATPFVAVGIVGTYVGLYLEADAWNYNAQTVTDPVLNSSDFTTHITGTSAALILALRPARNVTVRIGAGETWYHFNVTPSPALIQVNAAQGFTNLGISIDDAVGNFTLIGTDVYLTKNIFLGFEYRDTTLTTHAHESFTVLGTNQSADLGQFNDSFNSIAVRLGLEF